MIWQSSPLSPPLTKLTIDDVLETALMEVGDSGVDLLPRKVLFILCSVDSILLLCGDPEVMQNAIN